MSTAVLAIGLGAALGAVLRWLLGLWLNALWPSVPPGTLAANLIGGYLVGVAMAVFGDYPGLAPEWRLLVMTGFLGGLTTFSTFSAEVISLIQQGRLLWATAAVGSHLAGSLALTVLGLATVRMLMRL